MSKILDFNHEGILQPGNYEMTFEELRSSILVKGPRTMNPGSWDTQWRLKLIDNCEILVKQLHQIGITEIFLTGSFVEEKSHPNDIDGYFECDFSEFANGRIQRELNKLDEHKVWTWDTISRKGCVFKQLPMWHIYRVEFYPDYGNLSGLRDKHGNPMFFPAAFRCKRSSDTPKGVIKIVGV